MDRRRLEVEQFTFIYQPYDRTLSIRVDERNFELTQNMAELFAEFIEDTMNSSVGRKEFDLTNEYGMNVTFTRMRNGAYSFMNNILSASGANQLFYFLLEHYDYYLDQNGWLEERAERNRNDLQ